MSEIRIIHWGCNGKYFLDLYNGEEFLRRMSVKRSYTKEELQEIANTLAENVSRSLEHALLEGWRES